MRSRDWINGSWRLWGVRVGQGSIYSSTSGAEGIGVYQTQELEQTVIFDKDISRVHTVDRLTSTL